MAILPMITIPITSTQAASHVLTAPALCLNKATRATHFTNRRVHTMHRRSRAPIQNRMATILPTPAPWVVHRTPTDPVVEWYLLGRRIRSPQPLLLVMLVAVVVQDMVRQQGGHPKLSLKERVGSKGHSARIRIR